MSVSNFIEAVQAKYSTGQATEHSYRPALEALLESAAEGIVAINEPKRVSCGAPDFVVQRSGIPIGHCEAKDLQIDIDHLKDANLAQKNRYLKALPNLIYTNGLDFDFFKEGQKVRAISIAKLVNGKIELLPDSFNDLENQLAAFASEKPQTITSSKRLAEMMAGKAILIKDIMGNALKADAHLQTELTSQFKAFKANLIHDITPEDFSDVYAETIAYGLFAARLHDSTPATFSRAEALELLPKSNPFLRSLFGYIAGVDLDDRIRWVIDELVDVFRACNLQELMHDFGRFTARNDPFIHFYETFLAEYNPTKRKARGVWYTPEPVVNFITRAVNDVLKRDFELPLGLADTSRIAIDWETGQTDTRGKRTTLRKQVHKVQILDPATGTGTFLAEIVKNISSTVKHSAEGVWSDYVERDLIPRLHGFELLMASYAMCHMKLDMMLTELHYKASENPPRLSVYLTNSLEEGEIVTQNLFAQWLANEAKSASEIKRQMPIMCVVGNPPYAGESSNKGDWIMGLMEAFKKEPGGKARLDERNPKWINDDYVKFIRFAEYMVDKNGEGIVGFITNHGYLDNPTFRGIRWHLLQTFDEIHILNLHGSSNRKELVPEGLKDKNVFDIKPGVAIAIFVKRASSKRTVDDLATIKYFDVWGTRDQKQNFLFAKSLNEIEWQVLDIRPPHYMFVPWDYETENEFKEGFALDELMPVYSNGIVTGKDSKFISNSPEELLALDSEREASKIQRISYRPFEKTYIYFDPAALERARLDVMKHYIGRKNVGLLVSKAFRDRNFAHVFVTEYASEAIFLSATTASNAMNIPLYLYPDAGTFDGDGRVLNFAPSVHAKLVKAATGGKGPAPDGEAIFNYIYGVLHSSRYRERYRQALTIDFPHVPYPKGPSEFAAVAKCGAQLRSLHLMDATVIGPTPYTFKGEGTGVVLTHDRKSDGRIEINPQQWFEGVPEDAWNFYVGGYQPAQKWLKDRKGIRLGFDDIQEYQRIIKVLSETAQISASVPLDSA